MTTFAGPWLSEDEVLFHRMEKLHRERVEAIAAGHSPLAKRDDGILVLHLLPRSCFRERDQIDAALLKEHGKAVPPLGGSSGRSRFNVDGILNWEGAEGVRGYSQVFRDGRLEAALPEVAFPLDRQQKTAVRCLTDSICEKAMFDTVGGYLRFCKAVGISTPVTAFTALVGCKGVRLLINSGFRDVSEHDIDRSPLFFPPFEITSLGGEPVQLLRPWCDTLWQACGMIRSFNYDETGNWSDRRR